MKRLILLSIVFFFVTGCATLPPPADTNQQVSWSNRQISLNKIQNWQLNGKVALRTDQESVSATLDWQQHPQQFAISLLGPLGSHGMTLSSQANGVVLETSDGKKITAKSPEELLNQQWGWRLPVSYLKYWVRGLPAPSISATTQFDSSHRLSKLTQQGWHIQFLNYTTVAGVDLPQKLSITGPNLQAKLIIYDWKLNSSLNN